MDSQWLKAQFQCNPGKTKAGLASALGLEPPAISKILSGDRQIKAKEYNLMRQYFGLPVDGQGALENNRLEKKQTHAPEWPAQEQALKEDADFVPAARWSIPTDISKQYKDGSPGQIQLLQVHENVMEPDFKRGENVLLDLSDVMPSPPGVFAVSDGFGLMIRHCELLPDSEHSAVKISAKSKGFQTQTLALDDFKIIGRVIAKLHWV